MDAIDCGFKYTAPRVTATAPEERDCGFPGPATEPAPEPLAEPESEEVETKAPIAPPRRRQR